jgi:NADPH:quinone reductase-like Zn-dependent oxidoreductase
MAELAGMFAAGTLHPVEPQTYPLERAADALRDLSGRAVIGKAVLLTGRS